MKIHRSPHENYENHENHKTPCENYEKHKNHRSARDNHENQENRKIQEIIMEPMKTIRNLLENHKTNNENVRFQCENEKNHDIKEFHLRIIKIMKII